MLISKLMRLDGRLLLSFYVLAQELHFGRAAARLHMSQPPLSQHIKKLEELVGAALFERSTRQVRLTPAGLHMLEYAQRICTDMQDMLSAIQKLAKNEDQTLTLGIAASAAQTPLIQALRDYKSTRPELSLELHDLDSVDIMPALQQQTLDLALMRPYSQHKDIRMHVVHREQIGLVTPPGELLGGRDISLKQLLPYRLIGYKKSQSPYFHQLLAQLFAQYGLTPHIVQESRLPEILTLVEVGVAYAIVPWSMAKTRSDTLHFTPIQEAYPHPAEIVVASLDKHEKPRAHELIHFLLHHPALVTAFQPANP